MGAYLSQRGTFPFNCLIEQDTNRLDAQFSCYSFRSRASPNHLRRVMLVRVLDGALFILLEWMKTVDNN